MLGWSFDIDVAEIPLSLLFVAVAYTRLGHGRVVVEALAIILALIFPHNRIVIGDSLHWRFVCGWGFF